MEQLRAIWAALSLGERKKFLVDESVTLLGSLIDNLDEASFFTFLKQLGTLAEMGEILAIEMDFAIKERDIKAKVKALYEDTEGTGIDENLAQRLSDLSVEVLNYITERNECDRINPEEDTKTIREHFKAALEEGRADTTY